MANNVLAGLLAKKKVESKELAKPKETTKIKLQLKAAGELQSQAKKISENIETFDATEDLAFPEEFYSIDGFNPKLFEDNLMGISEQLDVEDPNLKGYVKAIYENLTQFPELAHFLSDKQIGLIFKGLSKVKNKMIAAKAPPKTTAMKKVDKLSKSDILDLDI